MTWSPADERRMVRLVDAVADTVAAFDAAMAQAFKRGDHRTADEFYAQGFELRAALDDVVALLEQTGVPCRMLPPRPVLVPLLAFVDLVDDTRGANGGG